MPLHTGLKFHYVIADPKVLEQHIYRKYFKCNSFQVTTDLLNRENLKVAITQYAMSYRSATLLCYR